MRINKHFILPVIILGLLMTAFVYAEEGKGGYAGAFLQIGVGTRALGMGGAFTAIADDGTAIYWNPAGLSQLDEKEVVGMYSFLSLDRHHNFVSFSYPAEDVGTFSLSWLNFGVSKIDGRDQSGNPTGDFSDNEMAFQLAYGRKFTSMISIGLGYKYLNHSLADYKAHGFGFDIGVMINATDMIAVGFAIQDIGSKLKWDTESDHEDEIPMTMRGGAAISPPTLPLKLAIDLEKNTEQDAEIHFGAEYQLMDIIGLRAGYHEEICAGVSFHLPIDFGKLQVDYVLTPDSNLDEGATHRIGLAIQF